MLGLPKTTEFNKRIPKQKFYDNLTVTPALKKVFVDQIKTIYWRNKIAASTTNLAPGTAVTELEVFEVKLNSQILDDSFLRQIDKEIPYHILFILEYEGKWAIVLALTSNSSAEQFQLAEKDGKPLYRAVMEEMMSISSPDNMMFVVGATKAEKLAEIRTFCPDNFLLVPGVGAQGGSAEEVMRHGANDKGGLLINSSRGILYADSTQNFAKSAAKVASQTARIL